MSSGVRSRYSTLLRQLPLTGPIPVLYKVICFAISGLLPLKPDTGRQGMALCIKRHGTTMGPWTRCWLSNGADVSRMQRGSLKLENRRLPEQLVPKTSQCIDALLQIRHSSKDLSRSVGGGGHLLVQPRSKVGRAKPRRFGRIVPFCPTSRSIRHPTQVRLVLASHSDTKGSFASSQPKLYFAAPCWINV